MTSNKVKLSQGDSGGSYEAIGSVLPEHDDEYNHFVLKGANTHYKFRSIYWYVMLQEQ